MRTALRSCLVVLALLAFPASALAATTAGQPFPSNLYSVEDATQATGLRVNLPKPDCAARPTDCADVDVLNTLDGFNIQPRISVPFSGPIDLSTVSSSTVFLVGPGFQKVGINQVVWEPAANTLHFESDQQLDQDVDLSPRRHERRPRRRRRAARHDDVPARPQLRADEGSGDEGVPQGAARRPADGTGRRRRRATTSPMRACSRRRPSPRSRSKIRAQIQAAAPRARASTSAPAASATVFPLSTTRRSCWNARTTRRRRSRPRRCRGRALRAFPGPSRDGRVRLVPVARLRDGRQGRSRPSGRATGTPVVQGDEHDPVHALRAGRRQARRRLAGRDLRPRLQRLEGRRAVGGRLVARAAAAIATIAINVVGHGGGAARHVHRQPARRLPPSSFPHGGRGIDQNGNGTIDSTEGVERGRRQCAHLEPRRPAPDGVRPDAARADDPGRRRRRRRRRPPTSSTSRIYYAGQSFGGIYGVQLLGVEPDIRAGVANVPGGPIIEIARLSPIFRAAGRASRCSTRMPSLYNAAPERDAARTSTRTSRCGTSRSSSTPFPARRRSRR